MTTLTTVDGFKIELTHRMYSCTDNEGVPCSVCNTYGTERTPLTLNSAWCSEIKRNTKGTERNTSTHH
jgi:hypothetical protein